MKVDFLGDPHYEAFGAFLANLSGYRVGEVEKISGPDKNRHYYMYKYKNELFYIEYWYEIKISSESWDVCPCFLIERDA